MHIIITVSSFDCCHVYPMRVLKMCLMHYMVSTKIIHKHERRQFVFLNKTKCEKLGFDINKIELLFYIENNQKYKNTNIKTKWLHTKIHLVYT